MGEKIKIAGAGLSGLTAGINLLRAGYRVIIYEKRKDVGLRFANDFQAIVNWMTDIDAIEALEKMNIETDFFINPLREGILLGPGLSEEVKFKSNKPIFYLIKRGASKGCIDFSLKQQFLKEGGEIKFNTKAILENVDIIATGPKKAKIVTLGYNFEADFQNIACDVIDKNLAPKVYAYLFIKNGHGTVATALSENFQNKELYLERTIKTFEKKLGIRIRKKEKIKSFADFFLAKTAKEKGRLYVGEAAGFQDSFVGLGMFFALRSGYLATQSIIEKTDYDKLWKNEFNNFLKVSVVNRFLFELIGYKSFKILKKIIKKHPEDLLDLIKKGYNFDWKMKLIYPIAHLSMRKRIKPRHKKIS